MERKAVISAEGHYGDSTHVWSVHRTREAAEKAAGPRYQVIRWDNAAKGEELTRAEVAYIRCYAR